MKHTPTPWRYRELSKGSDCFIQADRTKPEHPYDIEIMGDDTNPKFYPIEQKMADAKRIVACVNAMVGIEDPMRLREAVDEQYILLKELVRFAANDFREGFDGRTDDYKKSFSQALEYVKSKEPNFDPFVACIGVRSAQEATVQFVKEVEKAEQK